ncbi:hypothetical protein SEVIR_6G181499v4 [Setaria viridis]
MGHLLEEWAERGELGPCFLMGFLGQPERERAAACARSRRNRKCASALAAGRDLVAAARRRLVHLVRNSGDPESPIKGEMEASSPRRKPRPAPAEESETSLESLPSEIHERIVSLLPVRYAVRTSAVSRAWRRIWESAPASPSIGAMSMGLTQPTPTTSSRATSTPSAASSSTCPRSRSSARTTGSPSSPAKGSRR